MKAEHTKKKNNVIIVPNSVSFKYTKDGKEIRYSISENREYSVVLKNGDAFIAVFEVPKQKGEPPYNLKCRVEMTCGIFDVMHKSDRVISTDDIVSITHMHTAYVRTKRTFKETPSGRDDFEFVFNSSKNPGKKIYVTVYSGEFLSLAAMDGDRKRTYFGAIKNVDDNDNIVIDHYLYYKGERNVVTAKIPVEDLQGIFRMELHAEPMIAYRQRMDEETTNPVER